MALLIQSRALRAFYLKSDPSSLPLHRAGTGRRHLVVDGRLDLDVRVFLISSRQQWLMYSNKSIDQTSLLQALLA
jgi:hypothetical protein